MSPVFTVPFPVMASTTACSLRASQETTGPGLQLVLAPKSPPTVAQAQLKQPLWFPSLAIGLPNNR